MYVALFLVAASFRFLALKSGFVNDHFVYISGGRQMLFGDWPTRDWIDPGLPLMFAASAFAQKLFGPTLFAEAMLVSCAFGLAAALTAAAVRRLTGSMALAILAALLEIAVFPRTYSYPKIVAYAFAFWTYGWYLARPDMKRLLAMAVAVAIAFLFRHDHGLFLGIGGVLTILLGSLRPRADALTFAAFTLALVLPYLVFVQLNGGLWTYFRTGVEFSQREAGRQWHVWPRIVGDERPLRSAMVYELYALPVIALAALAATRARPDWKAAAAWVAPLAVVALLVDVSFIRDPLVTRLADAIVPAVLVGAWLLARAVSPQRMRMVTAPLALAFLVLMGASALAVGATHDEIDRAGLLGHRQDIPKRFVERTTDLKTRFVDYQMPTPSSRLLVPFFHYVDRCTRPDDRLLVGGFMVEVPFYAQRLFAAGQEYFGSYFGSEANERFAFDRLQRQRAPFALLPSDDEKEFDKRFPVIAPYVRAHYTPLTDVVVDDGRTIHILVSRDLPAAAHDPETGWPCFR
jgi:hypothetical protein